MKPSHPLAPPKKPQGQPGRIVRPVRHPSGAKPLGQPTRGKTARNRLRQVDHFMLLYDPGLLTRRDGLFDEALFVDLGYGEEPFTALESAERLRRLNPALKILGVEIDPERVARAQPYADADTFFRLGGFNLPLTARESVRAIRAFNVLRQYEEADVFPAWERMAGSVLPGGLLVEGTSNPTGGIWAANVLRRSAPRQGLFDGSAWTQEALVFFTNFSLGFDPVEFQTILPKNYIHRIVPGQPIFDFFAAWKAAVAETSAMQTWGLRQWYIAAAEGLAKRGYRINLRRKWLSKGWMIWEAPCI